MGFLRTKENFTQEVIEKQIRKISKVYETPVEGFDQKTFIEGQYELTECINELYTLMFIDPASYGLPYLKEPVVDYHVRKEIYKLFSFFIDFTNGKLQDNTIYLNVQQFKQSCNKMALNVKDILNISGFNFTFVDIEVLITNKKYPNLINVLYEYAKSCSLIKRRVMEHFERFNYRYLAGNYKITVEDMWQTIWEDDARLAIQVLHTKLTDQKVKYKVDSEFFRIRYYYKNKDILIVNTNYFDVEHNKYYPVHYRLRCILDGEKIEEFCERISQDSILSIESYQHLCRCKPNCIPGYGSTGPESCGARKEFIINNNRFYICIDNLETGDLYQPHDAEFVSRIAIYMWECK